MPFRWSKWSHLVLLAALMASSSAGADVLGPGPWMPKSEAGAVPLAERIPSDALAAVVLPSPAELLRIAGYAALRERFAASLDGWSADLECELGHDLLDPAVWGELGVALDAPAGFAWLDMRRDSAVLFARLRSEGQRFEAFLRDVRTRHDQSLEVVVVGDARVLFDPDDPTVQFIIRPPYVALVVSDAWGSHGIDDARRLAALLPADSLATRADFATAVVAQRFGRHAGVWVDLPTIARAVFGLPDERQRSAHPGEEEPPAARLWRETVGAVGPVALGVEIDGGVVRVRSRLELRKGSLLQRLLRKRTGASGLARALERPPLLFLDGVVDKAALVELISLLIAADGGSMDEFRAEILEETGQDLDRDILASLDGAAGIVLTGEVALGARDPFKDMGGAIALGLADQERARVVVERLLDKIVHEVPYLQPPTPLPSKDGWVFPIRDGYSFYIRLLPHRLVISTDPALIERLRTSAAGPLMMETSEGSLAALISSSRVSLAGVLDPIVWAIVSWDRGPSLARERARERKRADVPKSPETARKEAALDSLGAEFGQKQRDWGQERSRVTQTLLDALGVTAFVVHVDDTGFVVEGGQFSSAPTFAGALSKLIGASLRLTDATKRAAEEYRSLEERRWKLEQELERLRAEDIRRHDGAGGNGVRSKP